jgi:hypothetical protein
MKLIGKMTLIFFCLAESGLLSVHLWQKFGTKLTRVGWMRTDFFLLCRKKDFIFVSLWQKD